MSFHPRCTPSRHEIHHHRPPHPRLYRQRRPHHHRAIPYLNPIAVDLELLSVIGPRAIISYYTSLTRPRGPTIDVIYRGRPESEYSCLGWHGPYRILCLFGKFGQQCTYKHVGPRIDRTHLPNFANHQSVNAITRS